MTSDKTRWWESKTILIAAATLFGGGSGGGIVTGFYSQGDRIEVLEKKQKLDEDILIDMQYDLCMYFASGSDDKEEKCKEQRGRYRDRYERAQNK